MSIDEQDAIVGRLIREYKDAEINLASHKEKMLRLSRSVKEWIAWMEAHCHPSHMAMLDAPQEPLPSAEELRKVAAEITKLANEVRSLKDRKAQLGLS